MSIQIYDRVQETTNSTGTGNITLSGAVNGFRTFASTVGVGNPTYYGIVDDTAKIWEIGIGTLVSSDELERTTVITSSNNDNLINLINGNVSRVFIDVPASERLQVDASTIGISGETVFYGDGSNLSGLSSNQSLPFTVANSSEVINNSVVTIMSVDEFGNIVLSNAAGEAVFYIDEAGNPVLKDGNSPGFNPLSRFSFSDNGSQPQIINNSGNLVFSVSEQGFPILGQSSIGGFISFDENGSPQISNSEGYQIFGINSDTQRPIINGSVWPAKPENDQESGYLYADQYGALSWQTRELPLQGSDSIINNSNGTTVFSISGESGFPVLSNGSGTNIFSVNSFGFPMLGQPGFGGSITFSEFGEPEILNTAGNIVLGIDNTTQRPTINGSVWPATPENGEESGSLYADQYGTLSWQTRAAASTYQILSQDKFEETLDFRDVFIVQLTPGSSSSSNALPSASSFIGKKFTFLGDNISNGLSYTITGNIRTPTQNIYSIPLVQNQIIEFVSGGDFWYTKETIVGDIVGN